jgi:hypothetical protein
MDDLHNFAADGIEEAISQSTVAILCANSQEIGAGCAVRWNNRFLILTADHVIGNTNPEDIMFFCRQEGSLIRGNPVDFMRTGKLKLQPRIHFDVLSCRKDPKLDLAVLEVTGDIEEKYPVRFIDLDVSSSNPINHGETVALLGFPSDQKLKISNAYIAIPAIEWTKTVIAPSAFPPEYDSNKHLVVEFTSAAEGRKPHGFSGGGAWFHKSTPELGIWHPNIKLTGICLWYHGKSKLLAVLKIECIVKYLTDNL